MQRTKQARSKQSSTKNFRSMRFDTMRQLETLVHRVQESQENCRVKREVLCLLDGVRGGLIALFYRQSVAIQTTITTLCCDRVDSLIMKVASSCEQCKFSFGAKGDRDGPHFSHVAQPGETNHGCQNTFVAKCNANAPFVRNNRVLRHHRRLHSHYRRR